MAAHWSSWADCIHMIRQRHPSVAETLITGIHRGPAPCFAAVRTCQGTLEEAGLEIPSWRTLADTPPQREDGAEPAEPKVGWQHRATRCLEDQHLRVQLWPTLTDPVRTLMRSQCGPLASAALTVLPTSRATRLDPQPFRMWLCRRLFLPLPLSSRTCRCGRLLDVYGHHRAACSRAGVLGTRGFPLERAAAQICREAGGRVGVDRFVRDLDLVLFNGFDQRRIEVIVDGLTLWHGAQLAVDTTLVSPLHGDGSARRNAATTSGVALRDARRAKERTYPELTGEGGRARLVVLAAEVGGRWSEETALFLGALAKARAQESPQLLQGRVSAAYIRRWSALLACSLARSFTLSLLEQRPVPSVGADIPSVHEVLREARFV